MSVISRKLDPLVGLNDDGSAAFFKHVSARAAFELGVGHRNGLVSGSDSRSTRPGTHTDVFYDYYTDERAINFNAYDGNPANMISIEADDAVLLGSFEPCTQLGCINVSRSVAESNNNAYLKMSDQTEAVVDGAPALVNDCLNTAADGAWAEFPVFDLYLTNIGAKPLEIADLMSYPTICIADQAGMADAKSAHYDITTAGLQMTGSCEYWILWMKVSADVPANSAMAINGNRLTAGK